MNTLQPVRFYLVVLTCFMAVLVAGAMYFVMGMSQASYLVTDGVRIATRFIDKPRYDMHLQGLIFTLVFLLAGALLLLLVILPDRETRARPVSDEAPQPRRQPERPAARAASAQEASAAQADAQPATAQSAAADSQPAHQTSPLSIEGGDAEAEAPAPQPEAARPGVSVEEEVLQSAVRSDDLPMVDFGENRFDDSGDEDVVYGNGRITEDAGWEFVQQYPDSAVKFLYRKTLDNKSLSPTEEDIYRNWEMRGLTRAKVREIVLDIMRWQSLPDNFPHEIWRELRDQIFEIKSH